MRRIEVVFWWLRKEVGVLEGKEGKMHLRAEEEEKKDAAMDEREREEMIVCLEGSLESYEATERKFRVPNQTTRRANASDKEIIYGRDNAKNLSLAIPPYLGPCPSNLRWFGLPWSIFF